VKESLPAVVPQATTFEPSEGDTPYWFAYREGEDGLSTLVGIAFLTSELAPDAAIGYGGRVPVLVGTDMTGRILGVRMLSNSETPDYGNMVNDPNYLEKFRGLKGTEIELGKGIDAVSGATITSTAVADGVRASADKLAADERIAGMARLAESAGGDTPPEEVKAASDAPPSNVPAPSAPAPSVISALNLRVNGTFLLLMVVAIVGYRFRLSWLRYITLVLSLALLGLLWHQFLSVRHFSDLFQQGLGWVASHSDPSKERNPVAIARTIAHFAPLALAGIAALFMGRVFCGWVCPFGALTELIGRLSPWKVAIPSRLDRRMRSLKYVLLLATPLLFAALGPARGESVFSFEPFLDTLSLNFLHAGFPWIHLAWLAFLLIATILCMRFYCKYLCPVGAGLGFVSRQRLLPRWGEAECLNCANCGVKCVTRTADETIGELPGSECLSCQTCEGCPRPLKKSSMHHMGNRKRRVGRVPVSVGETQDRQ
jgi:hypothetical protein